jgi:hypothetical protein
LGRNCALFVCIEKGQVVVAAGLEQAHVPDDPAPHEYSPANQQVVPAGAMGEARHGRTGSTPGYFGIRETRMAASGSI